MEEAGRVLVGPVRTPRILAGPTAAWSVYGAAKVPGVARPPLSKLLNGRADLSGDMALQIR